MGANSWKVGDIGAESCYMKEKSVHSLVASRASLIFRGILARKIYWFTAPRPVGVVWGLWWCLFVAWPNKSRAGFNEVIWIGNNLPIQWRYMGGACGVLQKGSEDLSNLSTRAHKIGLKFLDLYMNSFCPTLRGLWSWWELVRRVSFPQTAARHGVNPISVEQWTL